MQQEFSERILAFETCVSLASKGDAFFLRKFLNFERDYSELYSHLPSDLLSKLQAKTPAKSEGIITNLSAKNRSTLSNLLLAYRTVDIAAATLEGYPEQPLKYERTNFFGDEIKVSLAPFPFSSNSTRSQRHLLVFQTAAHLAISSHHLQSCGSTFQSCRG
jgi:hypothetical protein